MSQQKIYTKRKKNNL